MIAYGFPPEGSAGVYRPLRFVRHLPSFGWQPTVITLKADVYERFDPSLSALIPDIEVIRVRNPDPWRTIQTMRTRHIKGKLAVNTESASRIHKAQHKPARSFLRSLVHTIEAWCYHPDLAMGWIRPAVKAALRVCAAERPDVLWATAGPTSSFRVAYRVYRETGIPYVLDFRDAKTITFNNFAARRPRWARHWDYISMYQLLSEAQSVVFRYDTEAECFWRAYRGVPAVSKIHIIPNGYDGGIDDSIPPRGSQCKVLYTGTLSDYRYDTLLQALQTLKRSDPQASNQLTFRFVGEGTAAILSAAAALGLNDMITASEAVSHDEVIRLTRDTHVLLVLGRPSTMKGYELFAPAKLFSYLKSGRPIAGVLPADEAKKVLQRVGVSTVANVDSVSEIVALFRKILHAWNDNHLSLLVPVPEACQNYSSGPQTRLLVRALERQPSTEPFVPGLVQIPASLQEELKKRACKTVRKKVSDFDNDLVARSHS